MKQRRVVVTGIGTINPLGNSIEEYFSNLEKGVSGAGPITHFDPSNFKTKFACELKGYDAASFFDRKELRKYDLYSQYALVAAEQAVKDSGVDLEKIDRDMVGVIWGSGIGGLETFYQEVKSYVEGGFIPRYSPFFIPKMIADLAAGHISMKYGFRGPNFCTVSACSSSNHAMIDSLNYIRWGKADMILTGGSEAAINPPGVGGFNSMQALSTRNDEPQKASRPFDADRDGFVIGEGAGALLLEEYEHAVARGAKIYAEVAGGGMSADAYHLTAPHPEGVGAKKSMTDAIKDAGIAPDDIDYVNTHGTSTPVGDLAEVAGIVASFGDHVYDMNISSTKSMTGHLLGAAGAIEGLACIMAITKGIVPPTINVENLDPKIDPKINLTLNKAQKRDVKYALSNTFGFGGHIQKNLTDVLDRIRLYWKLHHSRDKAYYKALDGIFGVCPNNIELYKLALIHRSASLFLDDGTPINNERLEFLGDAVLESIVSDYLFIEFPEQNEGFLTKLRSRIVSRASLNKLAVRIGLDRHIITQGNYSSQQKNLYGDALEAMVGALYLDKGYDFTNRLIINHLLNRYIDLVDMTEQETDFKSRLIEWSQKNKRALSFDTVPSPLYTQKIPHFHTSVSIDGQPTGTGEGHSKKSSEQKAALSALIRLRETGEHGTAEHIEE